MARPARLLVPAVVAATLGACGSGGGPPRATVVNDRARPVSVEHCPRQRCADTPPLVLGPGEEHDYPLREVALGGSADMVRITEGTSRYCVLLPPADGNGIRYVVTVSGSAADRCD